MNLRPYQQSIFKQLTSSSANDLVQLDTGAGKTPIMAALAESSPYTMIVAHRNVLIKQASEKLAAFGLAHDTISTELTRRQCMSAHRVHGRNYISRGHKTRLVASIGSLISAVERGTLSIDCTMPWLIVIDEAHHVVPDNQWGRLKKLFPAARIVGFTATPARMDGQSLHVSKDGLFDRLVQARELGDDSVSKLISAGYLCRYRAYAAPVAKGESAIVGLDYDSERLQIYGDPIAEYKRRAPNSRAILMAPSIKNAEEFAEEFRAAGIPAACVSSAMSQVAIERVLSAFAVGEVRVLTNVDMVGEGFDLPAVETLIICTRTASFPRYRQWVGRILRPAAGKQLGTIIDHTGMTAEHGMPDEPITWDLIDPPVGPKKIKDAPCQECGHIYKIMLHHCPECGAANDLYTRSQIGGFYFKIEKLDISLIARMAKEKREASQLVREELEICWPTYMDGGDLIGRTVQKLRKWAVDVMIKEGVAIKKINEWLKTEAAASHQTWIKKFTVADVGGGQKSEQKVMRLLK